MAAARGGADVKRRVATALATWFGCGFAPVAPGTVGTFGALPLYLMVRSGGALGLVITALAVSVVGIWAAGIVVDTLDEHDPQVVVIDEVAGVLLALAAAPCSWLGVGLAVALFRFFDIVKPAPARAAESLPRGWGVVVDDLVAGAWAAGALLVLRGVGVLA